MMSRRKFVSKSTLLVAGAASSKCLGMSSQPSIGELKYYLFSKHLQFLNYKDMAEAAAEIGFDGMDLTVRPKGHVLPERVADDLPLAVEAIRGAGLRPDLMASGINNAENDVNRQVLETASQQGVKLYRLSYLNFSEDESIPTTIANHNVSLK